MYLENLGNTILLETGLIIKLHKKEFFLIVTTTEIIMFLSVTIKFFSRVILNRNQIITDPLLREEHNQAVFRKVDRVGTKCLSSDTL